MKLEKNGPYYLVEGLVLLFKDNMLTEDKTERVITANNREEMHTALIRLLSGSTVEYSKYKANIEAQIDTYMKSGRVRKMELVRTKIPYKLYGDLYEVQFRVTIKLLGSLKSVV